MRMADMDKVALMVVGDVQLAASHRHPTATASAYSRTVSRASLSVRIPANRGWRNRLSGVHSRNSIRATMKGCSQQHAAIFAPVSP